MLRLVLLPALRLRARVAVRKAARMVKLDHLLLIKVANPRGGAPERERKTETNHHPALGIRKLDHLRLLLRIEVPRPLEIKISPPVFVG